jgi:glycosyltransferase involved in cell wall biosynthesis
VVTALPNHPTGVVPPRWRGRLFAEEREPGVRVLRTWLLAAPARGALRRTLAHVTAAATGFVRALGVTADVVVATSPPLFTGLAGALVASLRGVPFVLEVRDLWPDAFVDLGLAREGPAVAAFRRLERWLYRRADHLVPVTESFAARIAAAGGAPAATTVVRNGADLGRFASPPARETARASFGLDGRFTLLYLGAHGVAQGLDRLLPAARDVADRATFWFVGEGAEKERLVAEAARLGLANVRFDAAIPRERVPEAYAAADAVLVSLRATPLMGTFLPSKAFEAMAAGKPVVAAVAGESAALLGAGGGAVVVPPGDASALARVVGELASDPARVREAGRAARARAEREFDRDALATRYLAVLEDVVARGRGR